MTDREKVIKAFEICYTLEHNCTECPLFTEDDCNDKLMHDALTLLKEPKENKWIDHFYRFNDARFECKSCHRTAARSYPFCPWCGLAMNGVEIETDFV